MLGPPDTHTDLVLVPTVPLSPQQPGQMSNVSSVLEFLELSENIKAEFGFENRAGDEKKDEDKDENKKIRIRMRIKPDYFYSAPITHNPG